MAQIRQYQAEGLGIRPTETGVEAQAATGRRIGAFYNQEAESKSAEGRRFGGAVSDLGGMAVQYVEQREKSFGAKIGADKFNNLDDAWNTAAKDADPNDPSVAAKFREQTLEPELNKFVDGFQTEGGRKWAEAHANSMRDHFYKKTSADMSTMAGLAAHNNVIQTADSYVAAARKDPTSVQYALDSFHDSVDAIVDSAPNLTAVQASKIKTDLTRHGAEQIVRAGIQSMTLNDPEAGLRMSQDPRFAEYVDAGHAQTLYKEAVRAKKTDALMAQHIQKQQLHDASERTMDEFNKDLYSDNPTLTNIDIAKIPDNKITPAAREHLFKIAEKIANQSGPTPGVAKANAAEMFPQIRSGEIKTVDEIYAREAAGDIDATRRKQLIQELVDPRTPNGELLSTERKRFMSAMGPVLNPRDTAGNYDPKGKERIAGLEAFIQQEQQRMRDEGKPPWEIFKKESPDFVGNSPYARGPTPYELQKDAQNRLNAANNPKNPLNQRAAPAAPGQTSPNPTAPPVASAAPAEKPPAEYPDAKKAPDGNWYVEKEGKFFKVNTPRAPMSR